MTLKYRQGHRQSYHLKADVWFRISNFSFCGGIVHNFLDIGRGNENIGWNDLQMSFNVIKRGTSRKLVYELLLLVYSNFRRVAHRVTRDTYKLFQCWKPHFAYTTCIDLEFEGHAVGMWRRNLAPEN